MNKTIVLSLILFFLFSCSHKKQIIYVNDLSFGNVNKINSNFENNIEIGDILKIEVTTALPEVSVPYNSLNKNNIANTKDLIILDGYEVYNDSTLDYPVLGKINVVGLTEFELATKLKNMLVVSGHLTNPYVKVTTLIQFAKNLLSYSQVFLRTVVSFPF